MGIGLGNINSSVGSIFTQQLGLLSPSTLLNSAMPTELNKTGFSFDKLYNKENTNNVEITNKDISLQTSTYGRIIAEIFGNVRLAGNIIWCTDITTTNIDYAPRMSKNGLTGGYSQTLVRASFAIAICKGIVDSIDAIYADDININLSDYNITIYLGTENQEVDSVIENYVGNGNTPAFKGLCYIVFEDFPLENFSNRIPNFTFDVVRLNNLNISEDNPEKYIKAITLIPGSGEFVYDTITQKKLNGYWLNGQFISTSKATILNNHTSSLNTNSVDSLEKLIQTCQNLEWISLVVTWFGNNLDASLCSIYPAVEHGGYDMQTSPSEWEVAGIKRAKFENGNYTFANVIGRDSKGNMRYGGTPSDDSIVRLVKKIKEKNIKIMIYPMLMMDVENKPWRGYLTTQNPENITNFFEKSDGYNRFITHYAELLKNDINGIIIGSEMRDLTAVKNINDNNFPAVNKFYDLAINIKNIVGNNVVVTYAADWSEYHHTNGGWYNMDKLWSCNAIDVIGIDAYFPLSNSGSSIYNIDEIMNGWTSGEGYDYYYIDSNKTQTAPLSSEWAWKNIEWFWSNEHYNPNGQKTLWIPKSKKIWFTEYGFPSVDCCTNEPNVFYSPNSQDSGFPFLSQGNIDFKAQQKAILSTEKKWLNSECVTLKFLYTWDARPYPLFPNYNFWSDGESWKYGHFLNGKLGSSSAGTIVIQLCLKAGLESNEIDVSGISDILIEGYIIDKKVSMFSHISILSQLLLFDAFVENGILYFKKNSDSSIISITDDDMILDENNFISFSSENTSLNSIPNRVELIYIDKNKNYNLGTAIAHDNSRTNDISHSLNAPIPLTQLQAQSYAWNLLQNIIGQQKYYILTLPIKYISLSPLDIINISQNNDNFLIKIRKIILIDHTQIKIIGTSILANENDTSNIYDFNENIFNKIENTSEIATTEFDIFDLYNYSNSTTKDYFNINIAIYSKYKHWKSASIFSSYDDSTYSFVDNVSIESTIGDLTDITNISIVPEIIDKQNNIIITLQNDVGILKSITDIQFYQFQNLILVGNEIISFRDVQQIGEKQFQLSFLKRGLFNTEKNINNHIIGEKIFLMNDNFYKISLPINMIGKTIFVKVVSKNQNILDVQSKNISLSANSLRNFSIININIQDIINNHIQSGIYISWFDRLNIEYSNNFDIDIKTNNLFVLTIFDLNNNLIRQIKTKDIVFFYSLEMQILDFGMTLSANKIVATVNSVLQI